MPSTGVVTIHCNMIFWFMENGLCRRLCSLMEDAELIMGGEATIAQPMRRGRMVAGQPLPEGGAQARQVVRPGMKMP
jgi:hypothetical protein